MTLKSAIALVMVMVIAVMMMEVATAQSTTEECRSTIAAMQGCLPYASGKAATPTADCCKVVNTTVQHNKDCLCQFIALVHQGSPEIVQLGVKEDKLVQLPSACNLKNVSASNCPKLSPTSAPSAGSMNTTSTGGYKQQQQLLGFPIQALVLLAMMAILLPFPQGFLRF
jgi:hypothetical protein